MAAGGDQGKLHNTLVAGERIALREWKGSPGSAIDDARLDRTYRQAHESVCYCLEGAAELHCAGSTLLIREGDSWTVPPSADHTYKILQPFHCLEATAAPPKA